MPRPDAPSGLLKQQAYSALKLSIQDGTFAAGEFLSERQLAARLGMSKTPVKAALERLEVEGFVAVAPQQGIVVRELSVQEVADQFEIRAALEPFTVRQIAGRLSAVQIDQLRQNLQLSRKACESEEISAAVFLDADFHLLFCEFLGNQEILRVLSQLRDRIHGVIRHVFHHDHQRLLSSVDEHEAIAEAVITGQGDLAARRVVQHLEYGRQFLLSRRPLPRNGAEEALRS